jgi:hypothetical protein
VLLLLVLVLAALLLPLLLLGPEESVHVYRGQLGSRSCGGS